MKAIPGGRPSPDPIQFWSPSNYELLIRCPLALAYSRDPDYRAEYRRDNTFSCLGSIVHKISEELWKGEFEHIEFSSLQESLTARWQEIAESEYISLCGQWTPNSPPELKEWPNVSLLKFRTVFRLMREAKAHRENPIDEGAGPGAFVEQDLQDEFLKINGRPDRVVYRNGKAMVVDIKSGANISEISESHLRQLLLYAYLVQKTRDVEVDCCALITSSGEFLSIPVDQEMIATEAKNFQLRTSGFNSEVESARDFREVATPNRESCRYCDFRPVCSSYWLSASPDWEVGDVLGEVVETDLGGITELRLLAPGHRQSESVTVGGINENISSGAFLAVTGARNESGLLRLRWNSRAVVWPEIPAKTLE